MLPWEEDPNFFTRLKGREKHHYVPKEAVVRRFLEPAEWDGIANKDNHLRELDVGSGSIGWIGWRKPGMERNLNFAGDFSSEKYWGEGDKAMSYGASELAAGDLGSVFLMIPGLAVLAIRHPWWRDPAQTFGDAREASDGSDPKRAAIRTADRVTHDWVTAMDRGRVSVLVEVVPDEVEARLVMPDVIIGVRDMSGEPLRRAPWLWADEWVAGNGEAEPGSFECLTLAAPISPCVHLTISAGEPNDEGCLAEAREVDERRVRDLNARGAERAVAKVWAGRKRDLEALPRR
jgi:hypothetical protein